MSATENPSVWEHALVDIVAPGIAGVAGTYDGTLIETFWVADPDSALYASGFTTPDLATASTLIGMFDRQIDPYNFGYTSRDTPPKVRRAFLQAERDKLSDRIVHAQDDIREIDLMLEPLGGA